MTALPTVPRPVPADAMAPWGAFALAAAVFVLDATVTIHVLASQPLVTEQNPIARLALEAHPIAPYLLKGAIVGGCAMVVTVARRLDEAWAGHLAIALMAAFGLVGIASAVVAQGS